MLALFAILAISQNQVFADEVESADLEATTSYNTMYRLYNKYTGEHFYTASSSEKSNLVKVGWNDEGTGWYAPKSSNTPVYRLYNKYVTGGDHHYTTSTSERDTLKKAGWSDEGTGWYSDDSKSVPLYRQYNPFAQSGTHNYTTSSDENKNLVSKGWKEEGVGWYGVDISSYASGFWLGTKNASEKYVDEAYFAKNDSNYHSSKEIMADMKVLHDSSNANYKSVKAKWDKHYNDDNIRLYATYEGGENEPAYDGKTTSQKNKYVEFRILEVSGADGHKNHDGTSDGSAVTFMATHVLPTAYQVNGKNTNEGGWGACQLFSLMNSENGAIYNKFASGFVLQIKSVPKEFNSGNKSIQTSTPSIVSSKFWIPSYAELVNNNASDYENKLPKFEGTQYAWCKKNVKNTSDHLGPVAGANPCLTYKTRAGKVPGSCSFEYCHWWERSPNVTSTNAFGSVYTNGTVNYYYSVAIQRYGVVPCFCF